MIVFLATLYSIARAEILYWILLPWQLCCILFIYFKTLSNKCCILWQQRGMLERMKHRFSLCACHSKVEVSTALPSQRNLLLTTQRSLLLWAQRHFKCESSRACWLAAQHSIFFFLAVRHFWLPGVWRSVLTLFRRSPFQSRVRQQGTGTRCTVFSEKQDRHVEGQSLLFIFPFTFPPSPFAVAFHVTFINTWPKPLQSQPPQSPGTSTYFCLFLWSTAVAA